MPGSNEVKMAISIGSVGNAYGMNYVQPMNYALKNESEVSDAFIQQGAQGAIPSVTPVGYPNATIVGNDSEDEDPMKLAIGAVQKSQEVNKVYNDVASRFQGMTVGYSQNQAGYGYEMAGAKLDLFA